MFVCRNTLQGLQNVGVTVVGIASTLLQWLQFIALCVVYD